MSLQLGGAIEKVKLNSVAANLKYEFLYATGYGPDDILVYNSITRRFLTMNGGDYLMEVDGTILHIDGPSPDPEDRI